jgi:Protein of unknown function (DUF433)
VAEIVLDKIAYGSSREEIHFQHPHLSLAQIHAALSYYYENQKDLDRQIEADLEEIQQADQGTVRSQFPAKIGRAQTIPLSVRFYMDVNIRRAVTGRRSLAGRRCPDCPGKWSVEARRRRLLQRATDLGRVLVSQDADLLREAARRLEAGKTLLAASYMRTNCESQSARQCTILS